MSHRDLVQLVIVTFFWALCYPLIDVAVADAPPLSIGAIRAGVAGLVVLGIARFQRRQWPTLRVLGLVSIAGLALTGVGFAGMFLSGGRISPGLATVIANVQPMLAAVLGIAVLRERLGARRTLALALGFVGIVVTAAPSLGAGTTTATGLGIAFVLLGAVGVALGNVVLKYVSEQVDPLVAVGWSLVVGAIPLWALASVMGEVIPQSITVSLVASVSVLTLLGTALVAVLWLDLLGRHDLVELNVFTFLTPVFGLFISLLFFEETLIVVEWIGVGLILFACVFMQRGRSRLQPPSTDATALRK